jgi:hypothetical protein
MYIVNIFSEIVMCLDIYLTAYFFFLFFKLVYLISNFNFDKVQFINIFFNSFMFFVSS